MATLFIALKLIWKRKFSNFILLLQILISVVMLSQVYVYIVDHHNSVRAVSELPTNNTVIMHTFDYYSPDIVTQRLLPASTVESIGNVYVGNVVCNNIYCNIAVYDKSIITHYSSELATGVWLTEGFQDKECIPAVVSNDFDASIGTQLSLCLSSGRKISILIIGILKRPTQYLYPTGSASPQYFSASSVIGNSPVVILCDEDLRSHGVLYEENGLKISNNLFIFLHENSTDTAIGEEIASWNKYGEITHMSSLISTYTKNTTTMIVGGIITFGVFFALAITSLLSNNVIQSTKNRYIFTVYYLLGMNWKRIALTELIRTFLLMTCMVVLSTLAGRMGLLMLDWMTEEQIILFYGIVFLYEIFIFASIGSFFLYKLMHNDISASLKELQHGE